MADKLINIVLTDDFGRTQTKVKTGLSVPRLMDKILEYLETGSLLYMVDNLTDENMTLRRDGTRLKLVMGQIIKDLEEAGGNEKYINWIKENCNLELYNRNDIEELKEINRKRTVDYIDNQRIVKGMLKNAKHSIEYDTILQLSKELGIDLE